MRSELLHKYKTRVSLIKVLIEKSLYQGTFSKGLYGKFQAKGQDGESNITKCN